MISKMSFVVVPEQCDNFELAAILGAQCTPVEANGQRTRGGGASLDKREDVLLAIAHLKIIDMKHTGVNWAVRNDRKRQLLLGSGFFINNMKKV